jgi:tight adherence protein C
MQSFAPWASIHPDSYSTLIVSVLVFVAGTLFALSVMGAVRVRGEVKRRALAVAPAADGSHRRALRYHSLQATQKLADYTNRHFSHADKEANLTLRARLVQAGFLDPRAIAFYLLGQIVGAGTAAALAAVALAAAIPHPPALFWPAVWVSAFVGYLAPRFYVSRRIARNRLQHRHGFPDFMDLMAVCVNAGLSMEAALDRVGRELSEPYPSLGANIHMTTLELRAGRTLGEALEQLGDRLGLDEARGFATLLQQSQELGSSLTDTLRVYSDDMRHKRMAIAEEKAHSLPAKLSVPLIVCIFPVIIIVILLPVYVRIAYGIY